MVAGVNAIGLIIFVKAKVGDKGQSVLVFWCFGVLVFWCFSVFVPKHENTKTLKHHPTFKHRFKMSPNRVFYHLHINRVPQFYGKRGDGFIGFRDTTRHDIIKIM